MVNESVYKSLLKEVSPYVIVVGSYARGVQTNESDIDFYIKRKPQEVIDKEMEETWESAEESYIKEIIAIINKYGLIMNSVIIGHISVDSQVGIPKMLEFTWHYKIPKNAEIKKIIIEGIEFDSAIDDKDANYTDCIDYVE